jgi:RNA-splicing ligase RtcB
MAVDSRLTRLDRNRVRVENPQGIDALLLANENVPVEPAAVTELLELLDLQATVEHFAAASPESFDEPPRIERVAITPDSMGASSFVLAGQGNPASLFSASHGAGRTLSRGDAVRGHDEEFRRFLERFRIVTPVDLRRQDVRQRREIYEKKLDEIKQEAPCAYKGIGPVVETLTDAGIARPVAELTPLLTVKG